MVHLVSPKPSSKTYDREFRRAVGQRLKTARKNARLTMEQVSTRIEVSRQVVAYWESGRFMPMPENFPKIASLYSVSVDWLLGLEKGDAELGPIYAEAHLSFRSAMTDLPPEAVEEISDFIQFVRQRQRRRKSRGGQQREQRAG